MQRSVPDDLGQTVTIKQIQKTFGGPMLTRDYMERHLNTRTRTFKTLTVDEPVMDLVGTQEIAQKDLVSMYRKKK